MTHLLSLWQVSLQMHFKYLRLTIDSTTMVNLCLQLCLLWFFSKKRWKFSDISVGPKPSCARAAWRGQAPESPEAAKLSISPRRSWSTTRTCNRWVWQHRSFQSPADAVGFLVFLLSRSSCVWPVLDCCFRVGLSGRPRYVAELATTILCIRSRNCVRFPNRLLCQAARVSFRAHHIWDAVGTLHSLYNIE